MSFFRPLPLLGNPHVQTILGNLLTGRSCTLRVIRHVVPLPDGDQIVLHETPPRSGDSRTPVALLVHGLGGSHRSAYMVRMAHRFVALGWCVVRMDLRAAGAGLRLARRLYNAGCAGDIHGVIGHLARTFPAAPLVLIGFSLGANIVLKYGGEFAGQQPATLRAIATMAPPIDLVRCSELLARYPFYDRFYVGHLTRQVAAHQRYFPGLPTPAFPRGMTLRQFDDVYTAPRWGYVDALDYYMHASSAPWIAKIRVPTLILTARDDPFVAVAPFEALPSVDGVEVHISEQGGHLGFLGADGVGGIRWAEAKLVQWLTRQSNWV